MKVENNIKIINLTEKKIASESLKSFLIKQEEVTKKIELLLVIGDLAKNKKLYNQIKKENIFTLVISTQYKKSKNIVPSIFVEEGEVERILLSILDSVYTKSISLDIEDLKLILQPNCMAFCEEGENKEEVIKKIQGQLKKRKTKDLMLVIYGDENLGLFEVEDIFTSIQNYNKKATIIFAVSNTLESSYVKVGIIANLVE